MDENDETLFIHYTFTFSMCRLVENMLVPSTFKVKAEVNILDESLVEVAIKKINYWLEQVVQSSIAVAADNAIGFDMLLDQGSTPRLQNPLMICPDEPTDSSLCVLMQSKLQALAAGAFVVGMVELKSDNAEGLVFTFVGDCEELLPDMGDWISGPTWFDKPWWARDDASTFDTVAQDGADLTIVPVWAYDITAMVSRSLMPQEAILLKANFEPRIIDGKDGDE
jgi:hypothetical protein